MIITQVWTGKPASDLYARWLKHNDMHLVDRYEKQYFPAVVYLYSPNDVFNKGIQFAASGVVAVTDHFEGETMTFILVDSATGVIDNEGQEDVDSDFNDHPLYKVPNPTKETQCEQ